MTLKRLLISAVLVGAGASLAHADETPQPAAKADAPQSIEKVTVVGTRNPRSAQTYPGQVDVLNQDQIEAAVPSTVSDLVKDMPNVEFDGGPRRTGETPTIRGLGGQDVLVLIDGVRQSWTSGHDGRFFLDPNLLVGVEVVKGPASALYGSGALGGVMAFRTANASDLLDPGMTAGVRATLGYQDVNDEFLRGLTGFTHQGDFDIVANIAERTSGDIKLGSGFDLQADDDVVTGFAKFGYSPSEEFTAQISYQGFRNDSVEPDNGQGVSAGTPVDKTVSMDQFAGHFTWKPHSASFINMNFVPYHVEGSVETVDPTSGDALLRDIKTDGFSLDNRTPFTLGAGLSGLVTIGGEWYQDKQAGRDNTTVGGVRSGVPNGDDAFWGIFGQIEATAERPLGAPGKLTIIPGIRFDSYQASATGQPDKEETAVSPKIAATYQPTDWFFVFGNTGKAFRAPGINELYLEGTHFTLPHPCYLFGLQGCPGGLPNVANSFVPNPNLEPETSKYWEAGAGLSFDNVLAASDLLQIKASYWEQDVDDFINLTVIAAPSSQCFFPPYLPCNFGTATASNVDARLKGTEIEARYDSDRWRVTMGYGTTDGKERATGFDLTGLPADRFTTSVTLKLPEIDARVGARMEVGADYEKNYNPATSDPSTEIRDGYTSFDLFATWLPGDDILNGALEGLRVDVGVENVGDVDYERTFEGVSEPGRNFKTMVSYTLQLH